MGGGGGGVGFGLNGILKVKLTVLEAADGDDGRGCNRIS